MKLLILYTIKVGLIAALHIVLSNAEISSFYDESSFDAVVVHARRQLAKKAQRKLSLGNNAK
jgi:hypothetical protein